jgi:hypothetical protein
MPRRQRHRHRREFSHTTNCKQFGPTQTEQVMIKPAAAATAAAIASFFVALFLFLVPPPDGRIGLA